MINQTTIQNDVVMNTDPNPFVNIALGIGRISAWELDLHTNDIILVGQLVSLKPTIPTKYSWSEILLLIHEDDREFITMNLDNACHSDVPFAVDFRMTDEDGSTQWITAHGKLVDDYAENKKMIGVFFNTSAYRKKAEEFYKRQAKFANLVRLSSMGEMASIISHEISQPLVVINTYIAGCIRRLNEPTFNKHDIIAAMRKANEFVEVAGTLIHRMKTYIKNEGPNFEKANIHHIIERAVAMLPYDKVQQYSIKIECRFDKNLPMVEVDEFQIKFVILSLMVNGIEAMMNSSAENPTLVIQTSYFNQTIIVSVKDQGVGLSDDLIEKLFNAHYKTKEAGSGLSLLICKRIIEAHNGYIGAENLPEGGAHFNFTLPLIPTK